MNTFQTTVLSIALVVLMIIFIVIGIVMANNRLNIMYPPSSLPCPNYWQLNSDGTCNIPVAITPAEGVPPTPPVNFGTWDGKTLDGKTTVPGLKSGTVNFNNANWGSGNQTATCAKQKWAKQYGILWDGVSNYNGCA